MAGILEQRHVVEQGSVPAYDKAEVGHMLRTILFILSIMAVSSDALAQALDAPQAEVENAIAHTSSLVFLVRNETLEPPILEEGDALDSAQRQNPIKDDAYLHPVDSITPYTLNKGEWIYAQSIQTLPFPSWTFVGVTDNLTAQIDLLPWVFGYFSELKKPIPSLNFRYRFNSQSGLVPTIAVEAMFVHFWDTFERFDTPSITMWEKGTYLHLKPVVGYRIKENWGINLSLGVDYIGELTMRNNDPNNPQSELFTNSWNPNLSIGLDYRPSNWISYHIGYTYGSTFTFLENIPRKQQLNYGFRMAPFYKNKAGVLRNMRIELVAINGYFADIDARQSLPIPVFPYFYWQWDRDKEERKRRRD
ncbi:MAG: hypothetical protein P8R54_27945 [Myxococcota bacterium]|nr:hypothetical protein [Myxococcota bacterium]